MPHTAAQLAIVAKITSAVVYWYSYCTLSILGSRVWHFGVTWRHRSRDHLIPHRPFPISGPLERSLSPTVFEILDSKHIEVTSLTFQGYVTSSVTRPFDTPYAVSYWWTFGIKPLSLTIFEIFNVEWNAMVDMTLIWPLNKGQDHSFWCHIIRLLIGCQ